MDLKDIITQKRSMLDMARQKVADLERQISVLESVAQSDDFDVLLASKVQTPTQAAFVPPLAKVVFTSPVAPLAPTLKGRNPKGAARKILIDALSDGQTRDLDFLEEKINAQLPSPITRPALRTALMYMREHGEVISPKAGYFHLAHKGENPGATGSSSATMSATDEL